MTVEWTAALAAADIAKRVTIAAYLLTSLLCGLAARGASPPGQTGERRLWKGIAIAMVVLAVDQLFDLKSTLTSAGRDYAKGQGWYESHRQVQFVFVVALTVVAVAVALAGMRSTRRMARSVRLALVGMVFIALFVLLRAASFHHFDEVMSHGPAIFNFGSLQELFGIAVVAAAAGAHVASCGNNVAKRRTDSG